MPGGARPGAGRPRGKPNKVNGEAREIFAKLCRDKAPEMAAKLDQIEDPSDWLNVFAKLAEYALPKLGRTEVTGEDGGAITVVVKKIAGDDAG